MPTDHPDGTRPIVISRADILTPIDIAHQVANVKTRIEESAINVPTKFVEQTANMETDFKAQSVGAHTEAEWEIKQAKDKNLFGVLNVLATGWDTLIDYTVTATKTLYVTQFSVTIEAQGAGVQGYVRVGPTALICGIGGIQGASQTLARPVAIPAGIRVYGRVYNCSDGTSLIRCMIQGYEI